MEELKKISHTDTIEKTEKKVALAVTGLYKKFCKTLNYNMLYGVIDLLSNMFNIKINYSRLRKQEFWAIEDISFKIYKNEITALLGINGSGKTTLIRMLAGIYNIEKGHIQYEADVKRIISIFGIKSGLHPALTGKENIYLKAAYFGLSKSEIEQKIDFIREFSSLQNQLDTPLSNYSSGMKTRLAMSIALSIDANILFIDEGFSFSDPSFKQKCFNYLREKYTQKGRSLIFATHQMGKIQHLADRVILLDEGKILKSTYNIKDGINEYLKICSKLNNTDVLFFI